MAWKGIWFGTRIKDGGLWCWGNYKISLRQLFLWCSLNNNKESWFKSRYTYPSIYIATQKLIQRKTPFHAPSKLCPSVHRAYRYTQTKFGANTLIIYKRAISTSVNRVVLPTSTSKQYCIKLHFFFKFAYIFSKYYF